MLIPWVHVWLGGRYLSYVMHGRKLPEPWVMSEMACHMMLRGAETFAVWMDTPDEFPADYPYPEYAAMSQFVYDVKGVQEGFNSMLRHNSFLRRARPMTFEVPGQRSDLGPQTAVWSGMIAADKALIRTISFDHGRSVNKTVTIYDRPIQLTFGARGQDYWVFPSGEVGAVEHGPTRQNHPRNSAQTKRERCCPGGGVRVPGRFRRPHLRVACSVRFLASG